MHSVYSRSFPMTHLPVSSATCPTIGIRLSKIRHGKFSSTSPLQLRATHLYLPTRRTVYYCEVAFTLEIFLDFPARLAYTNKTRRECNVVGWPAARSVTFCHRNGCTVAPFSAPELNKHRLHIFFFHN